MILLLLDAVQNSLIFTVSYFSMAQIGLFGSFFRTSDTVS